MQRERVRCGEGRGEELWGAAGFTGRVNLLAACFCLSYVHFMLPFVIQFMSVAM